MQKNKEKKEHSAPDLGLTGLESREEFDTQNLKSTKAIPKDASKKLIYTDIFHIAWPTLVELVLTQLASMVDMMMVGTLGAYAISAVGLGTQPKFVLMTIPISMNVGTLALVARYRGMEDRERAKLALRQAILLSLSLTIVICLFAYIFADELLMALSVSKNNAIDEFTLNEGVKYLKIQILGLPVMALTSAITSALRGIGNTKIALAYNMIANIVNVLFNYLLIGGNCGFPAWGVTGASIATVIGMVVAMIMALIVITSKRQYLRFRLSDGMKPDMEMLGNIVRIGFPAMVEQLIMRAGNIIYNKVIATLGTDAYAAHQICLNLQSMTFMIGQAFSTSATSLVGQSIGKKRLDMADAYAARVKLIGYGVAFIVAVLLFAFGDVFSGLYSDDAVIVKDCARILKIISPIVILQTGQFVTTGVLRGAGDTRYVAKVIMITTLGVRSIFAYLFVLYFQWGLNGAWYAFMCDQALRSGLIMLRFTSGKWKKMAIQRV